MKPKKSISDEFRQAIALRAYFIWEREGRPDGRQSQHWAMAEAEILSKPPAGKAAAPKQAVKKAAAETKAVVNKSVAQKPAIIAKTDTPAKKKAAVKTKKTAKPKAAKPPKG